MTAETCSKTGKRRLDESRARADARWWRRSWLARMNAYHCPGVWRLARRQLPGPQAAAGAPVTTVHPFHDPLSGRTVDLVIGDDRASTGVRHDGCEDLADVCPELDSAYCTRCQWQCRISGAWFMDVLAEAWPADPVPVRTCKGCGCTDDYGCDGGCWWVDPDLCSECRQPERRR